MTVTKADIVAQVAERLQIPKIRAKEHVEVFLETIKSTLSSGESVKLPGFGTFSVRHKDARKSGNLRTGETTLVPARHVVVFKPGKQLKARPIDTSNADMTHE